MLLGCFALKLNIAVAFVLIRYSASSSSRLEVTESTLPTFQMNMGTLPGFYTDSPAPPAPSPGTPMDFSTSICILQFLNSSWNVAYRPCPWRSISHRWNLCVKVLCWTLGVTTWEQELRPGLVQSLAEKRECLWRSVSNTHTDLSGFIMVLWAP